MNDAAHLSRRFDGLSPEEPLGRRVLRVLAALPPDVQADLLDDPRFRITREERSPGGGWTLWMACPAPGASSRCVVLRERLSDCDEGFAAYVIAHELAHAHLHNGGWGEIRDPERAADALAASWGFAKPAVGPNRDRPKANGVPGASDASPVPITDRSPIPSRPPGVSGESDE